MLALEDLFVANHAARRGLVDVEAVRGLLGELCARPERVQLVRVLHEQRGVPLAEAKGLYEAARQYLRRRSEEGYAALARRHGLAPAAVLDELVRAQAEAGFAWTIGERLVRAHGLAPDRHLACMQEVERLLAEDEARLVARNVQGAFVPVLGAPRGAPAGAAPRGPVGADGPNGPGGGLGAARAAPGARPPSAAAAAAAQGIAAQGIDGRVSGRLATFNPAAAASSAGSGTPGAGRAAADLAADCDGEGTLLLDAPGAAGLAAPGGARPPARPPARPDDGGARTVFLEPSGEGPPDLAFAPTLQLRAGEVAAALDAGGAPPSPTQPGPSPTGSAAGRGPASLLGPGPGQRPGQAPDRGDGGTPRRDGMPRRDPASSLPGGGALHGGRYQLLRELGRGAMGVVYLAQDAERAAQVAVKLVQGPASEEVRGRFKREILVSQRIRHEHVIEVLDAGDLPDGSSYMAMEVLDGESLEALLAREGALDPERALRILEQLLRGLAAVHEREIVHRDLKPANVQVLPRAEGDHLKLVDFGISRFLDQDFAQNEKVFMTVRGQLSGTPQYVAPEAVLDPEMVAPGHDVYACGVIAYELLTGTLPFPPSRSLRDLLADTVHSRPRALDEANPARAPYPKPLERLVRRLLEKDAELRPSDAAAALALLSEVRDELEGRGPAPSAGSKPGFTARLVRSISRLFGRRPPEEREE